MPRTDFRNASFEKAKNVVNFTLNVLIPEGVSEIQAE
jgi:hypothetical protein